MKKGLDTSHECSLIELFEALWEVSVSIETTSSKHVISRRGVLIGGSVSALASGLGLLPRAAHAADITIRWWTAQNAPAQLAAYKAQAAEFELRHPGTKIVIEPVSDEGYAAQLAAAFSSKQVPNIVTHLPSFAAANYWKSDLLEPMNDVVAAVGPEKFYERGNKVFENTPGQLSGVGIGNTAANMFWIRKDLMQKAGVDKIPSTWDELRDACKRMQGGGIYGAPLPYARNGMTTLIIASFIHLAGGSLFSPEGEISLDSDATVNALDFYRSMREFCPPGATAYSWGESLTGFVSGATATGVYTGRVLANVVKQNPNIAEFVDCATYPTISRDVKPWTFNNFPCVFIPKAATNMEMTKKFAAYLFDPAGYIKQLLAAPGHMLPVLKTIAADPAYLSDDLIKRYQPQMERMTNAAANAFNLGWESDIHKPNIKAGEIVNSNVLAEMVQRVVLNGENAKLVIGDTAKKIAGIMKA